MRTSIKNKTGYRFGSFVLDMDRGALFSGDNEIKLRPKPFEVLLYLVERAGKLVSRQELLDAVWNGAVVTDDAVTQCLIDIRKGLDDTAQGIIKTVPRRGYIFDAQVVPIAQEDRIPSGAAGKPRRPIIWIAATAAVVVAGLYLALTKSPPVSVGGTEPASDLAGPAIAVMPLVNMSSDEENAYFAGGIHEEVFTSLSRIEDLHVISRTAMLRYAASEMTLREISSDLGVDYVLEGSVRRIDNHVRVTIQLTNAHNDVHLWANNYERELVDVFATQSELAREITDSVLLELKPESIGRLEGMPTNSVKAYDLYIRAASIEKTEGETEESTVRRRAMLEQAVTEDPDFVEAWGVLKRVYDLQLSRLRYRNWYLEEGQDRNALEEDFRDRSQRALNKSVSLDPENVETLLSIAVDHQWPKTHAEMQEQKAIFDRLVATYPKHAKTWYHLAWWHAHLDDLPGQDLATAEADAAAAFDEALRLDPFNARIVNGALGWFRTRGSEDQVTRLAERLNQIVPETAADRNLARVEWSFRHRQILAAFMETADESLIADYERRRIDAVESDDYDILFSQYWYEMVSKILSNDTERLLALARIPIDVRANNWTPFIFSETHMTAMNVHLNAGDISQARRLSENILSHRDVLSSPHVNKVDANLFSLAHAHAVLGNTDEARSLAEQLAGDTVSNLPLGVLAMSLVDTERAVDIAFMKLAKNPNWDGFDWAAIFYIWSRQFLSHPRVHEHYVKEGKWIDYLAARVPEYANQ